MTGTINVAQCRVIFRSDQCREREAPFMQALVNRIDISTLALLALLYKVVLVHLPYHERQVASYSL